MSGLLLVRSQVQACYVSDRDGVSLTSYLMPVGAVSAGADLLRTQVGSPDGTVWLGAKTAAAEAVLRHIVPATGEILQTIIVNTFTDITDGYNLALLPGGEFLLGGTVSGAKKVCRIAADGTVAQTYGIPADTSGCFALAHDGRTLYYWVLSTTVINRWDLVADAALPPFGDLGVSFEGQFILTATDQVLGVYTSGSTLPRTRLLQPDGSLAVLYTPSDLAGTGHTGGCAYELSTNRVYMSMAAAGGFAGILMAFDAADGTAPLWSTRVTMLGASSNIFGRVVVTPPDGPARAYPADGLTVQEPIYRMRTGSILTQSQLRVFYKSLQLVCQTGAVPADGVAAQVCIQWTDDYGGSWSPIDWQSYGVTGDRVFRVLKYQLGQSRNRAFRVMMTSTVPVAWLSLLLDAEAGTS